MNLPQFVQALGTLQPQQAEHDRAAHRTVLKWRRNRRLRHYTLHFGKYLIELSHGELAEPRVMVDTLIITLAMANALNLSIVDMFDESLFRSYAHVDACGEALLASFSSMCKLAEAREHREEFPYDEKWRTAFTVWLHAFLWLAQRFSPDPIQAIPDRWRQVESNAT